MKKIFALAMLWSSLMSCSLASSSTPWPTSPPQTISSPPVSPSTFTPSLSRFGIFVSRQDVASRLGVVNAPSNSARPGCESMWIFCANRQDYTQYLASGINVVLMVSNQDPSNVVTTYGTLREWPNAGFPYKSKAQYQQQVRSLLRPAVVYLVQG